MARLVTAFSGAFFLTGQAQGQATPDASLAAAVSSLVTARLAAVAPGGVVVVAKKGAVAYEGAFGVADVTTAAPMRPDLAFRIGSLTKQFTAVAILQLVEAGKISLQDTIQRYVVDFPAKKYPITIENLLTHTSGIKDYMAISNPAAERASYTPQQGVAYFKDEALEFKPGSRFQYSNSNYYLLGYLIELVTGQRYASYLQQHVLAKAGLRHTAYLEADGLSLPMPQGYSRFGGKLEPATLQEPTTTYAAGALVATAEDLLQWHQALRAGKVVSKRLLQKARTPYRLSDGTLSEYGYGWYTRTLDGSPTLEHAGSTDGFQADVIYLPKEEVVVVTLFNCFEQDMDWIVLSNDIARLATGKPLDAAIALDKSTLEKYAGEYTYDADHRLLITLKDGALFVEDTNPNDRLPQVRLYARNPHIFFIKEAVLTFEFVLDSQSRPLRIITYNSRGKDAEWVKTK